MFKFLDKLAGAGAGSRMPDDLHARAKRQANTTNRVNQLARDANGFGTTRAQRNAAERALVAAVGERQAKKLIKDAADKAAK